MKKILINCFINNRIKQIKSFKLIFKGEIRDEPTWECLELFLSGIVRKEGGKLKLYNRIYETVFNPHWVEEEIHKLSTEKINLDF